jgi:hypothetical protein
VHEAFERSPRNQDSPSQPPHLQFFKGYQPIDCSKADTQHLRRLLFGHSHWAPDLLRYNCFRSHSLHSLLDALNGARIVSVSVQLGIWFRIKRVGRLSLRITSLVLALYDRFWSRTPFADTVSLPGHCELVNCSTTGLLA